MVIAAFPSFFPIIITQVWCLIVNTMREEKGVKKGGRKRGKKRMKLERKKEEREGGTKELREKGGKKKKGSL